MHFPSLIVALSSTLLIVQAHPGHDINHEIGQRAKALGHNPRDISHCSAKLKVRGHEDRTINRRSALLKAEREKRSLATDPSFIKARDMDTRLDDRDAATVLNTNHLSPVVYTPHTDTDIVFAGNQSCILVPEVTEGPYYVSGEFIRSDLRETDHEQGVDLILDIQVIDVSTCEPVPDIMVDFWHANSTGVYSGVIAGSNGNSADASNINTTHSRGLQPTDIDGVAQFTAFYPGHYTGRTHHIHVATHANGTILPNNTFAGTAVSHIGQLFFDQALSTQVEATSPYSSNTQPLTTNAQDGIFAQAAAVGDPVVEYSLLSADVKDGIFAWIAFGIDTSRQEAIQAAVVYGENGGVANSNGGGGPGGPPSGFPTRTRTSTGAAATLTTF
ncbi:Intradiol ring-cleavage dioxygenase [Leptodontidium sp. MPI-SDFR-AT-0119]|nr:Intradiol ring-cleavage dioxygenase [Leptodontidium sp. MPI-SDFR-AT-0119]